MFTFVKRLPPGCKAILTSRGRIGSGGGGVDPRELSEDAALATLAKLAESNPALAKTSEAERLDPLPRDRRQAVAPALDRRADRSRQLPHLHRCRSHTCAPARRGMTRWSSSLATSSDDFSDEETRVLCALTYFTLPAKVEHIAELAACSEADTDRALRSLVNRSLVIPSEELKTFTLVPLVADFLRKKKPEVVAETGDRLEKRAYALVVENGYEQHDRFPVLDAAWPTVAAALPRFLAGPNDRLQTVCEALDTFSRLHRTLG